MRANGTGRQFGIRHLLGLATVAAFVLAFAKLGGGWFVLALASLPLVAMWFDVLLGGAPKTESDGSGFVVYVMYLFYVGLVLICWLLANAPYHDH